MQPERRAGETQFYRCPRCERRYAQSPGRELGFRWGHPISYALYPAMFSPSPTADPAVVTAMFADRSTDEIEAFIDEIMLELDQPTQRVGEIVECGASEEALRDYYLRAFCVEARKLTRM